jgi:hypothetical protein
MLYIFYFFEYGKKWAPSPAREYAFTFLNMKKLFPSDIFSFLEYKK